MKISTKGRYALRLMMELGMNDSSRPVRIREIAEKQVISDKYLEQIISILNKAGFVRSQRGPQGGYTLARKTSEYTVGDILRLTEGPMYPVDCVDPELYACPKAEQCATNILWKKLNDAIEGVIDHVTLEDLIEWQLTRNGDYSI